LQKTIELKIDSRSRLIPQLIIFTDCIIIPFKNNGYDHVQEYDWENDLSEVVNGQVKIRFACDIVHRLEFKPILNHIDFGVSLTFTIDVQHIYLADDFDSKD
jgi:hypothetical protein